MRCPGCLLRLFAGVLTVSALLLTSSPAFAAPPADDTPDPGELRERLAEVAAAYEAGANRLGTVEQRHARVTEQVRDTRARLARTRDRIARIAEVTYVNGGVDGSALVLTGQGAPDEIAQRMATMAVLSAADDATLRDAERDRTRLDRQLADLTEVRRQARTEQRKLKTQRDELNAALREAARLAAEREAERKAKREAEREAERKEQREEDRATRSRSTGRFACPVGSPYTMMNTFGAPRGGGRSHEGVDIAAPKSTPLYAVEDGTVTRAYSNELGGIALILKGKSGDSYYYAHQEVNLVSTGERVESGQLIARVGMTGNAQGTIYHLHFERWPNGGSAVDPWPFLYPLCGKSG